MTATDDIHAVRTVVSPDLDEPIKTLRSLLDAEDGLREHLETSLRTAGERAASDLRGSLHDALEWPRDTEAYENYLRRFIRWIPQQTDDEAWKNGSAHDRNAREVSDRIAHFYWLVDQPVGDNENTAVERSDGFAGWISDFTRRWGEFLDTPDSFDDEILRSFVKDAPEYTVEESLLDGRPNMPSGWLTFNQFFARELNAGLRPIANPGDNLRVTSPADCSYRATYDIGEDHGIPAVTMKGTHRFGDVRELLAGSRHADAFAGGTFVHYMLPPSAYHRFHSPVAGRIDETFVVQGQAYMEVRLRDGEFASLDDAGTGYEFSQTRGVVTIDTAGSPDGDVGVVAVVPIGMSQVASVVLTGVADSDVAKGEEFGYFQFGGSDIALVFQAGVRPDVDKSDVFRHMGTPAIRLAGGPNS